MKQRASSTTYLHRLAEYSLGTMYRAEYQLKFTQNEGYNIAKFVLMPAGEFPGEFTMFQAQVILVGIA